MKFLITTKDYKENILFLNRILTFILGGKIKLSVYIMIKKSTFVILLILVLTGCSKEAENNSEHKHEAEIGVNMLRIQIHHSKLYFAAMNENWDLADHENHEMEETFEKLDESEDHEIEDYIEMIYPALETIEKRIKEKDKVGFIKSFESLNTTCNSCHVATNHSFIKIKTPDTKPFTNQVY